MKFYVTGKWEDRENIRVIQNELISLGHTITVDWTYHESSDSGFPVQYAIDDIEGVSACDCYVGRFINDNQYKGALVEMGAALALHKTVYIIGHAIDACIFCHHPFVTQFNTEEEFLEFIG